MAVELSPEQKQAVAGWIGRGDSLSVVQQRIKEDFGFSMTYMDVRFLVLELGVAVKDRVPPKAPEAALAGPEAAGEEGGDPLAGEAPAEGGVRVEMDRIMKPGSVISGTVVFSDGVKASWMLDQLGRLALDAGRPQYAPPQEDIPVFQDELRNLLSRRGF